MLYVESVDVYLEDIVFQNPSEANYERITLDYEDGWELLENKKSELKIRVFRKLFSPDKDSFVFKVTATIKLELDEKKTKKMTNRVLINYIDEHAGDVINPSGVMDKISYVIASVSLAFNGTSQFTLPFFYGKDEKAEFERISSVVE